MTETKQFQAEVTQILDLMVNALYSQREIFLRELVSNASDALEKRRFEEIQTPELADDKEKHIRLIPNKDENVLVIQDNGIGMSYDEVVQNLGTIAHSGTKEFLKKANELKDNPELIGQFGVGFYSAFMVASSVKVHTQRAGTTEGIVWESKGDGNYSIDKLPRELGTGTTITLTLKKFEDEDDKQDFTDTWTLKSIIKKYSDFVEFPIKMETTKSEPELDDEGNPIEGKTKTTIEDEILNSQKALWLRSASDIKDEEYKDFYKHLTKDWMEPLNHIHYKAEGTQEFSSLLYIPSVVPMDYNQREAKIGLNLYVKRVFITDSCEELIPTYMRFVKGLVDSSDLPLNVSREIIQKDRTIKQINKAITSKILRELDTTLRKDKDAYIKFWELFGSTLKEGIASDMVNKEKIETICLFKSNKRDEWITLEQYVEAKKEDQKAIYFITGETIDQLKGSPYLEKLKEKDYEVLLCTDPVDEWAMTSIGVFKEMPVESITKENLELDSEEEKKQKEEEIKAASEKLKPLTEKIQKILDEDVKEVKVTDRLVDSPVCLVSGAYDPSARMERMLESMGQKMPKSKRILEINPKHPVFAKMQGQTEETQASWAEILYNQALLNEGSPIKDPMKFSKQISQLMQSIS